MFLETLKYSIIKDDEDTLQLVIIAILELASNNEEIKSMVINYIDTNKITKEILRIGSIEGE